MTERIEAVTGLSWTLALCRKRQFSEYSSLRGYFVANSPQHRARHVIVEESLAAAHWGRERLDQAWLRSMVESAARAKSRCASSPIPVLGSRYPPGDPRRPGGLNPRGAADRPRGESWPRHCEGSQPEIVG